MGVKIRKLRLRTPTIRVNPSSGPPGPLAISGAPGAAIVGTAYSFSPGVVGGSGAKTYALTGTLPAGLTFSASTGAITGTPTTAGTTSGLAITVTDTTGSAPLSGLSVTVAAAPVVLAISGANGTAAVGDTASFTPTISGGTAPFTVTATGLPPGRAIQTASTGLTTGAYTTVGSFSATYTVTDSGSPQQTASFTRSVTVTAAPVTLAPLSVNNATATVGIPYTGTISGKTAGSTLSLTGSGSAGLSISGVTISGTPAAEGVVSIVETLAGATNSPRTSAQFLTSAASSAGLAMTQLTSGRVYQRSTTTGGGAGKGSGFITVPITLTAAASGIDYRLRDAEASGNPVLKDWTSAGVNIPASATSVLCPGIPADAKKYLLDLRANGDNGQIVAGTSPVMMGRIIGMSGQSQMVRSIVAYTAGTNASLGVAISPYSALYATYALDVNTTPTDPAWGAPADTGRYTSTFAAEFLRLQVASSGVACAIAGYSVGSTTISAWAPGSAQSVRLRAILDAVGGFEAYFWHQGGDDAGAGTAKTAYKSALDAMFADITQHNAIFGANYPKLLTAMATRTSGGAGNTSSVTAIRQAAKEWAAANSSTYIEPHDVNLDDSVHQTQAGSIVLAQHAHRAMATTDVGPSFGTPTLSTDNATLYIPINMPTGSTALVVTGNAKSRLSVFPTGTQANPLTISTLTYDSANQRLVAALSAAATTNVDVYAFLHPDPSGTTAFADMIRGNRVDGDGITVGRSLEPTTTGPVTATLNAISVPAPGQVTGLTAGTATSTTQPLSWTAPASGGAPTGYSMEYRTSAGPGTWTSGGTATGTSGTVSGLASATGYDYRVTATNGTGSGTPSSVVSATTAADVPGPAVGDIFLVNVYDSRQGTGLGTATAGWNNLDEASFTNPASPMALKNSAGGTSALSAYITNGSIVQGNSLGAVPSPSGSGDVPDDVLKYSLIADKTGAGGYGVSTLIDLTVLGFAAGTGWKVEAVGSRAVATRNEFIAVNNGTPVSVNIGNNIKISTTFTAVQPSSGKIDVQVTHNSSEQYCQLNAVRLTRTA